MSRSKKQNNCLIGKVIVCVSTEHLDAGLYEYGYEYDPDYPTESDAGFNSLLQAELNDTSQSMSLSNILDF